MNQRVHQNPLMEVLGLFPRELIHSELTSFPKNHNTCILLNYSVYKIIILYTQFQNFILCTNISVLFFKPWRNEQRHICSFTFILHFYKQFYFYFFIKNHWLGEHLSVATLKIDKCYYNVSLEDHRGSSKSTDKEPQWLFLYRPSGQESDVQSSTLWEIGTQPYENHG